MAVRSKVRSYAFSLTYVCACALLGAVTSAHATDGMYLPKPGDEHSKAAMELRKQLDTGHFLPGYGEADRLYDEAITARFDLEPEKSRALFTRVLTARGTVRAKMKARVYLQCYLPKYPVTPECEKEFRQYDKMVQSGQLTEALAGFQDMEKRYPKFEWVDIGLADIHLKREDPERAANCGRRALAINPDYVDAWLILAHESIMHHDMEGARKATDTAHRLDPYSTLVTKTLEEINTELAKKKPD